MKRVFVVFVAIALLIIASPLFVLHEVENALAYLYFCAWRSHRANGILFRHGWKARQAFIHSFPKTYSQFVARVYV